MQTVFAFALALTAAAGCVALAAPLLLQEVLAWRGGRAATVRVGTHTCGPACASAPGGPLVARDVHLAQPTLWSEHSARLCEVRVVCTSGEQYLLPLPPTHLVRPGDSFALRQESGRAVVSNCSTGTEMVLPRRLVKESSPLGSLAALPLALAAPFVLLVVFAGALGAGVSHKMSGLDELAGGSNRADIAALSDESDRLLSSGFVWLFVLAMACCAIALWLNSAGWPKVRRLATDGRLLDA